MSDQDFEQMIEALAVMKQEGTPTDLKTLSLVHRLLADDWTGTGVYEALDEALSKAEVVYGDAVAGP